METVSTWKPDTDIFVYSGDITPNLDRTLRNILDEKREHKNVALHLTTYGGDPDAAYKIARYLLCNYDTFTLYVTSDCKSAGTLLALGATEIVMARSGELGPLDVQLFRPDEFLHRSSGLAISQALHSLTSQAYEVWETMFLSIRAKSGGVITTKTASEIAKELAVGLFAPITDKIDPSRVGEMQRSMEIAVQYGRRLGASDQLVQHLASDYPSHSFVIDFIEAKGLFPNLRAPNKFENLLFSHASQIFKQEFGLSPISLSIDGGLAAKITVQIEKIQTTEYYESQGDNNSKKSDAITSNKRRGKANAKAVSKQRVASSKNDNQGDFNKRELARRLS